jgi:hypothetical protein
MTHYIRGAAERQKIRHGKRRLRHHPANSLHQSGLTGQFNRTFSDNCGLQLPPWPKLRLNNVLR